MINNISDAVITGDPKLDINNIEYDSRMVKANSLFVAVNGFKFDGYSFLGEAVKNGAVAVIGENDKCDAPVTHIKVPDIRLAMSEIAAAFYNYPGLKIKACGVTGTNGKTTTTRLITNILRTAKKSTGMITSHIYDTGDETFPSELTTPESLDMQRLLFLMKKNSVDYAVVEISSHALALKRVEHINFRVAVYTNLTRDHLDFHNTMEEYFEAKKMLIRKLEGPLSYAVINLDVPEFRQLFGESNSGTISYSIENTEANIYCRQYQIKPNGTIFDLVTPNGTRTVSFKLPGRFNLYNALAAVGGGLALGVNLDMVIAGLESSTQVPGRFNYIDAGQPFAVYVDYAHTPDAIERLCQATREICQGKIFILFSCGGDRDKGKRPLMGRAATSFSDFAILTSDNPRSEDPLAIIEDVKPGLKNKNYEIIPDRVEAIETILKKAKPGDAVLLAGKGAENYMEINGVRGPFNDTEEAIKVLNKLGYKNSEAVR